jgi:anti-sigma factor RsiW
MKEDSSYQRLREACWRGKLTPAQEAELRAWLAAHPEARTDWQAEEALTESLARLPHVPVPSNFTARVLRAARAAGPSDLRRSPGLSGFWRWRLRWLPRAAVTAVVLCAGLLSYQHIQGVRRGEIRQSLITLSEVPSLADPEVLQDFDAIQALSQTPAADEELLQLFR